MHITKSKRKPRKVEILTEQRFIYWVRGVSSAQVPLVLAAFQEIGHKVENTYEENGSFHFAGVVERFQPVPHSVLTRCVGPHPDLEMANEDAIRSALPSGAEVGMGYEYSLIDVRPGDGSILN